MGQSTLSDEEMAIAVKQYEERLAAEAAAPKFEGDELKYPADHVPGTPMIVSRSQYVDSDGVTRVKTHGPMPVADWPAYEKANKL